MSGKTKIAALLHSQPGIHKLKLLIGKALCILLFYSQSLTAAQTLLFSDDFDNTVSDSITDPSARAKGNLSSLLRYSWTSNPSQEIEIVDGKFDWIGETDNKGRLLTSVGANVMRFKTSNGSEINWNENNRLNGTRYEISFTYRTAWSHYLNFNLLDTLPNNKVDLSSDVQGDFVFGTNGTSVRTATDGSDFNYIANKVQADTTYQVRLLVNELAYPKTVQIYLDDVKITEEPIIITFENEERYFMFSNSGKYGGYIDNFNVSVHKPNVIIIYSDDHGYTDLGVQGIDLNVKTPNMDLLAQNGVRFTDGYCTAPQCVPSRGGLMAGRYQNRFGLRGNGGGSEGGLPVTEPCVAERFQEHGYRTGMIGKWHLGGGDRAPKNRGFDNYWDGALYTVERNFNLDAEELATSETVELPALPNRCIAQGKAAEAFVELNKDEPFFLYFAVYGPHNPLIDKEDPYFLNFPEVDYPHLNDEQDVVRRQGLALIHAV
ncbi:MAG: sulfatase-like hydrolase/transferase, partial [Lentisphaerales bacterium]|nr:sulfatase-like hydrolase/transferase [Lentisphaerales bacterium]